MRPPPEGGQLSQRIMELIREYDAEQGIYHPHPLDQVELVFANGSTLSLPARLVLGTIPEEDHVRS